VNQGTNAPPTSGQDNPYTLLQYDADGRMTWRERRFAGGGLQAFDFLWDGDDRLRTVKEGASTRFTATYDGVGLRVGKWDTWIGQHDFSRGPGGVVHDSNGSFVYTPGLAHRQGTEDRFYHGDWLGSTRYLSDVTGNSFPSALRFDAYGQRSATGGTDAYHSTDFQFAGASGYQTEYASATEPGLGLQYLEQRYYDPALGCFISSDPIGLAGGLNRFGYVRNNPVLGTDSRGLAPWYDRLAQWAAEGAAAQKGTVTDYWARYGDLGAAVAGSANSAIDAVAGSLTTPAAIGHLGEGTGTFAGNPTLANAAGLFEDIGTVSGIGLAVAGALRPGAFRPGSRQAARAQSKSCFPAGTRVATAEGDKPIETIEAGEQVLSADPVTGKQSYQQVKQAFVRKSDELVTIETAHGHKIEATGEHPFFVEGKGFVAARRLARSDLLKGADGRLVAVASVTSRRGEFTVYNLEVEHTHTYFAGGLWVHNECGLPAEELARHLEEWDRATFSTIEASWEHHFSKHGPPLNSGTLGRYLRQAAVFKSNLRGCKKTRVGPGKFRYEKNGRYIILDEWKGNKTVSFGEVR
jgi:RHS repeat-associated protein